MSHKEIPLPYENYFLYDGKNTLLAEGWRLYNSAEYSSSLSIFKTVLNSSTPQNDQYSTLSAIKGLILSFKVAENYSEGILKGELYLSELGEIKNDNILLHIDVSSKLAMLYFLNGEYGKAIRIINSLNVNRILQLIHNTCSSEFILNNKQTYIAIKQLYMSIKQTEGKSLCFSGDFEKGENSYKEALSIISPDEQGLNKARLFVLDDMAESYLLKGDYEKSAALLKQIINEREEIKHPREITFKNAGIAAFNLKNYSESYEFLKLAIYWSYRLLILEKTNKYRKKAVAKRINYFDYLVKAGIASENKEDVYNQVRIFKAKLFRETLWLKSGSESSKEYKEIVEEAKLRMKKKYKAGQTPEESDYKKLEETETFELLKVLNEKKESTIFGKPPSLQSLISYLKKKDFALIEYLLTKTSLFTFIVSERGLDIKITELGYTEIAESINNIRNSFRRGGDLSYIEWYSYPLVESLFPEEFREDTLQRKGIIIIPSSIIYNLPFDAIKIKGKYLFELSTLYFLPTSDYIFNSETGEKSHIFESFLGVSDPLRSLCSTDDEVHIASELFKKKTIPSPEKSTSLHISNMLEKVTAAHFACHSEFKSASPLESSIKLYDSELSADMIMKLNLSSLWLIVLASCSSGMGDPDMADNLDGIERAFLMAEAKYIISSLWDIPDYESACFMQDFYKELSSSLDIHNALNQAKLNAMNRFPQSYHWAAFRLTGI